MSLFKNDSKPDEDEKDLKLPSKGKFKDLSPVNKRRRKEPPKPWGRRERLLILFLFGGTIVASILLAVSARGWKLPGLPRFSFSEISSLFEGTYILEGEKSEGETFEEIKKEFKSETDNLSGVYGFYVLRVRKSPVVDTPRVEYGLYEDEIFQAASLIKLPVMVALYLEKPEGYQDLAFAMGKKSDNEAFRKARQILGDRKIKEVIAWIGMRNTSLEENETTMRDIGSFFEKLWQDKLLPSHETRWILEYLTDTIYEDHLAAGIPDGIRVIHKYGREVHVVNDAGIVDTQNPFVVVIMTKGVVESEADKVFPDLARLIYNFEISN